MRTSRLLIVLFVAAMVAAFGGVAAWRAGGFSGRQPEAPVGGPFHLTNQNGARVDESLLKGKWTAVFFGYTYCPEACPTTLTALARALDQMGPKARDVQVV